MTARRAVTVEDIARRPLPGMAIPGSLQIRPASGLISYLRSEGASLSRQLYVFDPETGQERLLLAPSDGGNDEADLSLEEKLRRERMRQFETGVTSYAWSHDGRLLLPLRGGLYLLDCRTSFQLLLAALFASQSTDEDEQADMPNIDEEGAFDVNARIADRPKETQLLPPNDKPYLDPRFAPNGWLVAYVHDAELYVVRTAGGEPRQLTHGARGTGRTHGLADFVAQEEMHRHEGYWWSTDSKQIAFTEVDETHIPRYRIPHPGQPLKPDGETVYEEHRYPFAGQANPIVRLGVVGLNGGEPLWLDLGPEEQSHYLARVRWLPDGRLTAQVQDRAQQNLRLLAWTLPDPTPTTLVHDQTDVWINLSDMFTPLDDGGFVWASERTGYMHLYRYAADGTLRNAITSGEWQVDKLATVDEDNGTVYFTATAASVLEQQLYAAPLGGGEPRRVSLAAGMHSAVVDAKRGRYVDVQQHRTQPPRVTLRSLADDTELAVVFAPNDPRLDELHLPAPELVSFANRHGTTLHAAVYRPDNARFGDGPWPTIVNVYGGPGPQRVFDGWSLSADLRAQCLREQGYLVVRIDNRGSARRGLEFEGALQYRMGSVEVDDQVDGVRWLVAQGLTDPARVGIYGWSYGGYMAAMCLGRAPEVFSVAVAGAPVTDWAGYDTHYTERYMGTPQDQPEAYSASAVMSYVEQIEGKLLLVHGMIDENVHFRHTAMLINALIQARKTYDLLLLPDERHSPRSEADRVYLEERVRDYFLAHLPVG